MSLLGTPPPDLWSDWISNPPAAPPANPLPAPGLPSMGPLDVVATFTGTLFDLRVPYEQVRDVLPEGVEVPQGSAPGQNVPVTLAVGYQEDVTARAAEAFHQFTGFSYMELVLGIPNVLHQTNGALKTFACLGRLCLDQEFPTELGRLIGLAKTRADFTTGATTVDLADHQTQQHILNGNFQIVGDIRSAVSFPEALPVLQTFSLKVICERLNNGFWSVPFRWSWHKAVMQELTGKIEIFDGFGKGVYEWNRAAGIATNAGGAWRVRVPWEMFWPSPIS